MDSLPGTRTIVVTTKTATGSMAQTGNEPLETEEEESTVAPPVQSRTNTITAQSIDASKVQASTSPRQKCRSILDHWRHWTRCAAQRGRGKILIREAQRRRRTIGGVPVEPTQVTKAWIEIDQLARFDRDCGETDTTQESKYRVYQTNTSGCLDEQRKAPSNKQNGDILRNTSILCNHWNNCRRHRYQFSILSCQCKKRKMIKL